MGKMIEKDILGVIVQVEEPEDDFAMPVTTFCDYDNFVDDAEKDYDNAIRRAYVTGLQDVKYLEAAKDWAKAENDLSRWAATLFRTYQNDDARKTRALAIFDKVTKFSNVRMQNVSKHLDLLLRDAGPDPDKGMVQRIAKARNIKSEMGNYVRRALITQVRYNERYEKGSDYESPMVKQEKIASARAEKKRELLPRDAEYRPAMPYCPYPVPEGQPVPEPPDPFQMAQTQPVDAFVFDPELKELVIKPGYVSEDGLIDDESVVYHPENCTVTMKFRGGEPVTWPYWKPKNDRDVLTPDMWAGQYFIRWYEQVEQRIMGGILRHDSSELEQPGYNKKPETST